MAYEDIKNEICDVCHKMWNRMYRRWEEITSC